MSARPSPVNSVFHRLRMIGAAATVALIGMGSPANAFDVVFVNPGKQGELFWDMTTAAMRHAAADLGHDVEVLYAERDRYKMREMAAEVISRDDPPEYLILVNEERFAATLLPEAEAAGVTTLLLLNGPIGENAEALGAPGAKLKRWLGTIKPDNAGAGRRMAERGLDEARRLGLADSAGRLAVLAIGGDKTTPASIDRQNGAIAALEEASDAEIERMFFARWSREQARTKTARYLAVRGTAPAMIWAANDEMALGAVAALREHGYAPGKDTVIVGLNWSDEALELVRKGEMLLTDGGHFVGGAWAIIALHDFHADPARDVAALQERLDFDMAAIDAKALQGLGDASPFEALDRLDFRRFSRVHAGEKALPLCLRAYLSATSQSVDALKDAHGIGDRAAAKGSGG